MLNYDAGRMEVRYGVTNKHLSYVEFNAFISSTLTSSPAACLG